MGDLISRSVLIIRLRNASVIPFSKMLLNERHKQILEFEDMIKTQATAYDVEKVIRQLEENKEDMIKAIERNSPSKIYMVKKKDLKELFEKYTREQIEIVKKGGV